MFISAFSILSAIVCLVGLLVGVAFFVKIANPNEEEFMEVRRMQGSYKSMRVGKLEKLPNEFGDYRIVRGIKWDKAKKRYVPQSALSSEGLRAAFPK